MKVKTLQPTKKYSQMLDEFIARNFNQKNQKNQICLNQKKLLIQLHIEEYLMKRQTNYLIVATLHKILLK